MSRSPEGSEASMEETQLTVSLLGPFQVSLGGEAVTHFGSDTVRALLAYLVMHRGEARRRDALAGLLWPEIPNADALRNLRVTLSRLRDAIRDRDADTSYLDITRRTIQFLDGARCSTDIWTMQRALAATRDHSHPHLDESEVCAQQLQSVVDLYRGEFLAGFSLDSAGFEEWIVSERERLRWEVLEALRQ